MELTNEVLEAMTKCNETQCSECLAVDVCCSEGDITIGQRLTAALLEERAKPKVWEGAHEWQDRARVKHYSNSALCAMDETFKDYTRTLPKSRIDEIAEEASEKYLSYYGACFEGAKERLIGEVKSAILKDRKEWEAER